MLNRYLDITKIETLEKIIEDAELRVGQYILNGGKHFDDYVLKQKERTIEAYERIDQIRELDKEKIMEKQKGFTLEL